MDRVSQGHTCIDIPGLSVGIDPEVAVASLRYFDAAGVFAGAVREAVGRPLPGPLRAVSEALTTELEGATPRGHLILAWRSPTETVVLSNDRTAFASLERRLAGAQHGCMVNQSGGIWTIRVQGSGARELMLRLGSAASIPAPGEARSSRLADLHVMAICVHAGEILLLVERVYTDHLLAWIRATAADFS